MHSSDTLRNTSAVRHGAIANMQDVHVSVDMSDLFIQYMLISRTYPLTYVHLIQVYGTLWIISHIHIQYIYTHGKETTTHAYHASQQFHSLNSKVRGVTPTAPQCIPAELLSWLPHFNCNPWGMNLCAILSRC